MGPVVEEKLDERTGASVMLCVDLFIFKLHRPCKVAEVADHEAELERSRHMASNIFSATSAVGRLIGKTFMP